MSCSDSCRHTAFVFSFHHLIQYTTWGFHTLHGTFPYTAGSISIPCTEHFHIFHGAFPHTAQGTSIYFMGHFHTLPGGPFHTLHRAFPYAAWGHFHILPGVFSYTTPGCSQVLPFESGTLTQQCSVCCCSSSCIYFLAKPLVQTKHFNVSNK